MSKLSSPPLINQARLFVGARWTVILFVISLAFLAACEAQVQKSDLNDRQIKALELVKSQGKITKQAYIKLTNTPKTTAFRDLHTLVKLHILTQKGTGKSSCYTLSD